MTDGMRRALALAALLTLWLAGPAAGQGMARDGMDAVPLGAMVPHGPHDPHMAMSPRRPAAPGDRARAEGIAARAARAIAPFRDPAAALAAGYRPFGDVPEARVVHYVHRSRSWAERRRLDPERPGALLYERRGGGLVLVGAMFTAPGGASAGDLDARVPLSQARWHRHVNICTPRPVWSRAKWAERDGAGRPVYGPFSPIATPVACRAAGGRFHDAVLGWMVHVYPFREQPGDWWTAEGADH